MNVRLRLLVCAVVLSLAAAARGELVWEKTELELHPAPGDAKAVGTFKYQNKGDKPVHIASVHTSCGCTTAGAQKENVAPGENGEITATFNIGDRTGVQQKTITVQTDDPKQPTTLLTLKAVIAQPFELQPAFVFWQVGEEAKPKTIVAKVSKDTPVKALDVVSSNPDFLTKVEHPNADEFRINVQPRETTRSTSATISIKPDSAGAAGKTYYASARVTPAAAPQP
jgi:hypothetical protein